MFRSRLILLRVFKSNLIPSHFCHALHASFISFLFSFLIKPVKWDVYLVEHLITCIFLMFLNTGEHACKCAPRFEGCEALAGFCLTPSSVLTCLLD